MNRTGAFGDSDRAIALSSLMESYQKYSRKATKPFTMVIGADDQAEIKTTWRERSRLLELAQQDKRPSHRACLELPAISDKLFAFFTFDPNIDACSH